MKKRSQLTDVRVREQLVDMDEDEHTRWKGDQVTRTHKHKHNLGTGPNAPAVHVCLCWTSWRVETDGDHAKLTDCIARMAPINKAKAAGVSAGSFLELRAQVSKQKEGLSKGNTTAIVGKKDGKVRLSPLNSALFSPDTFLPLTEVGQMGTPKQRRS